MILRRFSQAIINQNWSVVVLEIIVVVVGIFLGLQVNDWDEGRKLRRQESLYLDKLHIDLSTMQAALADGVQDREEAVQRMTAALYALEDCVMSDQAQSNLNFALERYQISGQINYLSATYDEMVASGALARIDDEELKQQITYSFSHLADLSANQRSFRVSMPVVDTIVWKTVSFSVDRETGRPVTSYDFAALCQNIELRNAIVEMIDIQKDSLTGVKGTLESVDELIAYFDTGDI